MVIHRIRTEGRLFRKPGVTETLVTFLRALAYGPGLRALLIFNKVFSSASFSSACALVTHKQNLAVR